MAGDGVDECSDRTHRAANADEDSPLVQVVSGTASLGTGEFPLDGRCALEGRNRAVDADEHATSDALNFLTDQQFEAFGTWRDRYGQRFATGFNLNGYPAPVLEYVNWRLLETRDAALLDDDLREYVAETIRKRKNTSQEPYVLHGEDLLAFHDVSRDRSTGFVVIIAPQVMALFLAEHFPNVQLTPALLRLTICYLGGLSLTESAQRDGKSVETRKSQARELRRRFGFAGAEDIARIVGTRLGTEISSLVTGSLPRSHDVFERYVAQYMPNSVRSLVLLDRGCQPFRILDMGPKSGAPLIVLHPMILPDIRDKDIDLLDELRLRLLWPLRNGLNAPEDPTLTEGEQIRHACQGIDLVRHVFCEDKIRILSLAASSKVALAYAAQNRANIEALFFAAACVLEGRPVSGVRRLAKGMLALASHNETLMSATMNYFRHTTLTSERFPKFIRNQFRASSADSQIVEAELAGPFAGERFREALIQSVPSARHDFGFQRALDWDVARMLGVEMHFLHGEDDPIHPLPLIDALVASLPGAQLHVIENAGQLLYHDHLRSVLTPIAERIHA